MGSKATRPVQIPRVRPPQWGVGGTERPHGAGLPRAGALFSPPAREVTGGPWLYLDQTQAGWQGQRGPGPLSTGGRERAFLQAFAAGLILSLALQACLVSLEPLEEAGAALLLSGLEVGLCPPVVPHSAGLSQEGGAAPLFCHLKSASFREHSKTSEGTRVCVRRVAAGLGGAGFPGVSAAPSVSRRRCERAGASLVPWPPPLCAGPGIQRRAGPREGGLRLPWWGMPGPETLGQEASPGRVGATVTFSVPFLKPPLPSRPQSLSSPLMLPLPAPHAPQHSGSPPPSQPQSCASPHRRSLERRLVRKTTPCLRWLGFSDRLVTLRWGQVCPARWWHEVG